MEEKEDLTDRLDRYFKLLGTIGVQMGAKMLTL